MWKDSMQNHGIHITEITVSIVTIKALMDTPPSNL